MAETSCCLLKVIEINPTTDFIKEPIQFNRNSVTTIKINCFTSKTLKLTYAETEEEFEFSVSLLSDTIPTEPLKLFSKSKNFYILFDITHKCSLSEFLNEPTQTHTIDLPCPIQFDNNLADLDAYQKDQLTESEIQTNKLILNTPPINNQKQNLIKNLLDNCDPKIISTFINKGLINEEDL